MTRRTDLILDFWFGQSRDDPEAAAARVSFWFEGDPQVDADIRRLFLTDCEAALAGDRDQWAINALGRLALIIVLDQFPRNIFRGTPRAFSGDARALALCLQGLDQRLDEGLHPLERGFFHLPLQHAEDPSAQTLSVERYRTIHAQSGPRWQPFLAGMLDHAREHAATVRRFGRFPHRNAILGRVSTPEEAAVLAAGAPDYGQR